MSQHPTREDIFNQYYPVCQAIVRGKTVQVKREGKSGGGGGSETQKRRGVRKFTTRSKTRLAFLVSETETEFASLLTLTFGENYPRDGKDTKKLLNGFLTWLRAVGDVDYCWFLEFQNRGAPHIHLLLTCHHEEELHGKIAENWARSNKRNLGLSEGQASKIKTQHKRPQVWEDIKSRDGAIKYVTKYALKSEQKIVPKHYRNVGRFWGASQAVRKSVPEGIEIDVTEDELRDWLAVHGQVTANFQVLPAVIFRR